MLGVGVLERRMQCKLSLSRALSGLISHTLLCIPRAPNGERHTRHSETHTHIADIQEEEKQGSHMEGRKMVLFSMHQKECSSTDCSGCGATKTKGMN